MQLYPTKSVERNERHVTITGNGQSGSSSLAGTKSLEKRIALNSNNNSIKLEFGFKISSFCC